MHRLEHDPKIFMTYFVFLGFFFHVGTRFTKNNPKKTIPLKFLGGQNHQKVNVMGKTVELHFATKEKYVHLIFTHRLIKKSLKNSTATKSYEGNKNRSREKNCN